MLDIDVQSLPSSILYPMRSQFLTILCIFSFISCGWGLIESGIALANPDRVSATDYTGRKAPDQSAQRQRDGGDLRSFYEERGTNADNPTPENPRVVAQLSLSQFVYSLVTLIGVLLMFRLRRIGFYVYLAGVVLGLALPLFFVGLSGVNTSFGAFFSVLFAVMYGFCLREMR